VLKILFLSPGEILVTLALAVVAQAQSPAVNGAGATFPYPFYSQWAHKYHELTGAKIN
jgi:phosphate transport system substrate-binding protein